MSQGRTKRSSQTVTSTPKSHRSAAISQLVPRAPARGRDQRPQALEHEGDEGGRVEVDGHADGGREPLGAAREEYDQGEKRAHEREPKQDLPGIGKGAIEEERHEGEGQEAAEVQGFEGPDSHALPV